MGVSWGKCLAISVQFEPAGSHPIESCGRVPPSVSATTGQQYMAEVDIVDGSY